MTATEDIETDRLRKIATEGVRALITLAGEDPDRTGLLDTPRRMIDAFMEMTARPGEPDLLLARTFDDVGHVDGMVLVGPIEFTSVCEHHLLPFTGQAWVAYVPGELVVGLSKLARLVDHYARRMQVQERLTAQIADAINVYLGPLGVGVRVVSEHSCMTVRGVRKPGAAMTTVEVRGQLRQNDRRQEFLAAAR